MSDDDHGDQVRLQEQVRVLNRDLERLETRLHSLDQKLASIEQSATQFRMIIVVIAAIGGVFTWVISNGANIWRALK